MTNSQPSVDPANEGTLSGAFREVIRKVLQNLNCSLPARVLAYDRSKNRASVQPQISMISYDDSAINRAQIASVPVLQIGGGGFILSYNLKSGDLGWIIANDRDISLFLQSYSEQKPNTFRTHDFADAFFIPDPMTGYTIAGEDQENAVLQSLDGSVKISLGSDYIKIETPREIKIESQNINIIGDVSIEGTLTVTDDVQLESKLTVSERLVGLQDIASGGNITASGSITPGIPP